MSANEMYQENGEIELMKMLLDEACRQWCDCIDECPERRTGENFGNFFLEISRDKQEEYRDLLQEIQAEVNSSPLEQDDDMER